jgi:hypothetical protein
MTQPTKENKFMWLFFMFKIGLPWCKTYQLIMYDSYDCSMEDVDKKTLFK